MEVSTPTNAYREWRDAVDRQLHQVYCITIEDAGFDEDCLINHWQSRETPGNFVEWYGTKHDLDTEPSFIQQLGK